MDTNRQRLEAALTLALADQDFMGNSKKVTRAVESLTPKDNLTATLKRLQLNANRDYLEKREEGKPGYVDEHKPERIKEYVHLRFKGYMEDPKTSKKANDLFYGAYPSADQEPPSVEAAA